MVRKPYVTKIPTIPSIYEEVQVAPTFWGWLFQFGSQAKVLGPERAVEMAKDAISDIADCYK